MLGIMGCDNPTATNNKSANPSSDKKQFFSVTPDSIGSLLELAVDTLRARQQIHPFVKTFIKERGLPVWEAYSAYQWEGLMYNNIPTWSNKPTTKKKSIKNTILNYIANNRNEGCQK